MELFFLYLWLRLGAIHEILFVASALSVLPMILSFIGLVACVVEDREDTRKIRSICKKVIIIALCLLPVRVFLPTQTDVAVLVGGHFALKAVQSPEADKIASLLRKKANEMLDEELKK